MNVYISKLVSLLVYPLTWVMALLMIGLLFLMFKKQKTATAFIVSGFVTLWIIAMPVTGQWLMYQLERTYPAQEATQLPNADMIVLLGGGMGGSAPPIRLHPNMNEAADRIWFSAQLFHARKAPYIMPSGGILEWQGVTQSEAEAMGTLLLQLGVPQVAIVPEANSKTTYENAVNSLALLELGQVKRILLVTSAAHLPRAVATFKRVMPNIEVIPAATDIRVVSVGKDLLDWLPQAGGIDMTSEAWHEWIGLWIYRFKGWA